ncbi:MAG: Fur family transcriptional regulator [Candidatus Omnitrophota bacterium]
MCDKCKCKNLIKSKGLRITNLRRFVIKVLTLAQKGLTPPEILKEIKKFHSINKVTIYRILDLFEKKQIIRRMLTSEGASRYSLIDPAAKGNQSLPPHFVCRTCNTIIELDLNSMRSSLEAKLGNKFGGPLELTIEGICPNCRKEKKC